MLPNEKEWIQDLLKQRYYTKDETTWAEICERVSKLGRTKIDEKRIYNHMLHCDFYLIVQHCLMQVREMEIFLPVMYYQWKMI